MRGVTVTFAGLILGASLLCPGCESPVGNSPDVHARYVLWEAMVAWLDYPIDEVYDATAKAVQQLDLDVMYHDHDGVAGQIATVDAQREGITIDMEARLGSRTILTIRAGVFGDKNKSEVILEQIARNLRQEVATAQ